MSYISIGPIANTWIQHWPLVKKTNVLYQYWTHNHLDSTLVPYQKVQCLISVLEPQTILEFDIGPLSKRPMSYINIGLTANTWIWHWSFVKKTNVLYQYWTHSQNLNLTLVPCKKDKCLISVLDPQPILEFDIGPLSKRPISYINIGFTTNTWIWHWSLVKKTNVLC